jgi:hypothetical protein
MAAVLTPEMLWPSSERKEAVLTWCRENDLDPKAVVRCEMVADGSVVSVTELELRDGRPYFDPATNGPAKRQRDIKPATMPPWLGW